MHTMKGHAMPSHTLPARAPRIALAPVAALALLGLPGSWAHAQGSDHDAHHTETPAASGDNRPMVTKKPKGLGRGLDALLGPSTALDMPASGAPATPAGTLKRGAIFDAA